MAMTTVLIMMTMMVIMMTTMIIDTVDDEAKDQSVDGSPTSLWFSADVQPTKGSF